MFTNLLRRILLIFGKYTPSSKRNVTEVKHQPSFPQFSSLPGELRNAIWHETLPNPTAPPPALVPWKLGCWPFEGPKDHPEHYFHHEMLDVNVELPIAYVNQEARSIALAWAQKHGFKPQRRKDQYLGFVRPFDVDRDALYLGPHQLEECFYEVFNALMAPEMENIPVSCGCAVKTLAISEKVARDPETLSWLREVVDMCMMNVKELLVIVGSSDSDFEEAIRQRRFGFTSAPMDELSWNKETRRFKFEAEEFDDLYGDRTLSRFVENSHGDLDFEHGFKIRPILAVQEQTREL